MDIRAANLKLISAIPGKWVVAAAHLGMTENALRNRVYELKGQSLPTDDSLALQQLAGAAFFAEAIATQSGGAFVKLPGVDEVENDSIQKLFAENYREIGRLYDAFVAAIADGEINDAEMAGLDAHCHELHRKTATLQALIPRIYHRTSGASRNSEVRHG